MAMDAPVCEQGVTPDLIRSMKGRQRITFVTAYYFPTAKLVDEAGLDMVLVGDTLAEVALGHETTLPVTFEARFITLAPLAEQSRGPCLSPICRTGLTTLLAAYAAIDAPPYGDPGPTTWVGRFRDLISPGRVLLPPTICYRSVGLWLNPQIISGKVRYQNRCRTRRSCHLEREISQLHCSRTQAIGAAEVRIESGRMLCPRR